jgi:hypothetical protein
VIRIFSTAILFGSLTATAFAAGTCPAVTAPGGRGNIHTEVTTVSLDSHGNWVQGPLRAIRSVRTYLSGTDANVVIGVDNVCPSQGCGVNFSSPRQDCTAVNTSKPFFGWALSHGSTVIQTKQSSMDIKTPSGTVVFSQGGLSAPRCHLTIPTAVNAMNTYVVNRATGAAWSVKTVRVVAGLHGGSGPLDYYAVIGVDPNSPATLPAPTGQDCTTASNAWYDFYWNFDGHQTIAESIVPYIEYPGVVQLNQGD